MSDSAILTATPLFDSISPEDLASMLSCLDARRRDFQREEIIFPEGESIAHIGLVLAGAVHIVKEDYWGRRTLMASIGPGECFGEAYACSPASPFPFTAVAAESASILFLNIHRVLTTCSSACQFHARLIRNLLTVLADSNQRLARKIECTSPRTIREKLLSYFSSQARRSRSSAFTLPFSRGQLAEYLAVDRSAMTVELYKLKDEGIIWFEKRKFRLLSPDFKSQDSPRPPV